MVRSLRTRFLVAAAGAVAFCVIVCLTLSTGWLYRSLRHSQEDAHLALASAVAEQLSSWVLEKSSALQAIAVGELWPIARGEEVRPLPLDFLKKNGFRSLRLFRRDGRAFQEVRLVQGFPPSGVAATETGKLLEDALARGVAVWSARSGQELQLLVAIPVPETIGGATAGQLALVGEVDTTSLLRRFLAEARHRLVVLRDGGKTPILSAAEHGLLLDASAPPPPLEQWASARVPAASPVANSENAIATAVATALGTYSRDHDTWLAAAVPMRVGDLVLYSEFPESSVRGALRSFLWFAAPVALVAMTGALLLLFFATGGIRQGFLAVENALTAAERGEAFVGANVGAPFQSLLRRISGVGRARLDTERKLRAEAERYRLDAEIAERPNTTPAPVRDDSEFQKKKWDAAWESATNAIDEMRTPLSALMGRLERTTQLVEASSKSSPHEGEPHSMPSELVATLEEWEAARRQQDPADFVKWLGEASEGRSRGRIDDDLPALRQLADYWQRETRILLSDLRFFRDQGDTLGRLVQRLQSLVKK